MNVCEHCYGEVHEWDQAFNDKNCVAGEVREPPFRWFHVRCCPVVTSVEIVKE